MAIRTLVLRGNRGWYWSGGGIVADSDPRARARGDGVEKHARLFDII